MKFKPSLVLKVLIPTFILIAIIHFFIFYQSYNYYRKIIILQKKSQVDHTFKELHSRLISIKKDIQIIGKSVSNIYDLFHPSQTELTDLLKDYLLYPGISGMGFFTPPSSNNFCVYLWEQDGIIKSNNPVEWFKSHDINYTDRLFYKMPYQTRKPYFCKPTPNDAGDKKYSATYSVPMFNNNKFIGVITIDLMMNWIDKIFKQLTSKENIDFSFVSKKGDFLVRTDRESLNPEYIEAIEDIIKDINNNKFFKEKFDNHDDDDFTLHRAFFNGKILVRVSTVFDGQAYLFIFLNEDKILAVLRNAVLYQAFVALIAFAFVFSCFYFIFSYFLNPIRKMGNIVKLIAQGNFDTDFSVKSNTKEVDILNRSIRIMQHRLKHYFGNIADNTRLKTEMEFAKNIQLNLIPEISSIREDDDIHWILYPAEEVGGDFCNYITFDDGDLYISIGDVTGKGIPAALYTAIMISMEKLLTKINIPLQKMVKIINSEIIKFNKSELYISYFNAVIDKKSGVCKYVNAGHLPALILKSDGRVIKTNKGTGTFLGIFDSIKFNKDEIKLDTGDIILLYTDGITEAVNENNELFGEKKLIELFGSCYHLTSKESVEKIYSEVVVFRGTAPQSDDLCMICYKHK